MSVPALRFTEFVDKWSVKRLEEISKHISYGLTVRPEYINNGIPLISAREIKGGVIDYENAPKISQESFDKLSNKAMAIKGDIFLSKTGTIGLVAYVMSDITIAITQNIAVIRILDNDYYHLFILQQLRTSKFYKSAIDKVNQSTIMDLQLQDIRKLTLNLPLLPEQTKIANFLTAVDEKITQLTQKHDLLTQYKKGVMQQIFSQELRFKDDDGQYFPDWEDVTIGEITSKVGSGSTPRGGEEVYQSSGVQFIRSQNVNNEKLLLDDVTYISDAINVQMKGSVVKPNDVLLNITGASIGRSCVVPSDFMVGNVNQHVCIIRLKAEYVPRFLQAYLSSSGGQKSISSTQVGSGREGLNFKAIRSFKVSVPTRLEQTKIANFLTAIDEKITATQIHLKAVKQYKQGLLQQMFV